MALALNRDECLLKEGFAFIGDVTAPQNIGTTGNGDPYNSFTNSESLGYMNRGSVVVNMTREYAELESDTTAIKIRKDLIRKAFMLTFNSVQITNVDLWEIRDGLAVVKNFVDSGFTGDIGFIGPDEPTQTDRSFLLDSTDVDGKPYRVMVFAGRITSEDITETRSGDAHVEVGMTVESFPHPNFDVTVAAQKQKAYGVKWVDKS